MREGGGNTVLTLVAPSLGNDASGFCQGSASHLPSGLWSKLPLPLFSSKGGHPHLCPLAHGEENVQPSAWRLPTWNPK